MEGKRGMERGKKETRAMKAIKLWTGCAFAAFLAATAIYLVLLHVEKTELSGYERKEVLVALQDVPEGQLITAQNRDAYFALEAIDARIVPEEAILSSEQLESVVAKTKIGKGSILTEGHLRQMETITAGMREPVVAGFRADDLCQVAGGVLRAGDRIHVFASEEGEGTFLIWENVYVQQVFDAGGNVIESGDATTAAQRINVFLDKEDVEAFYTRLEQGSLKVVKIWRQEKDG